MPEVKFETGKLGSTFQIRGLAIGDGTKILKRSRVKDCLDLEDALQVAQEWIQEGRHLEVKVYKVEHSLTLSAAQPGVE